MPDRSISGRWPITNTPAAMLLAASAVTARQQKATATSTLPAKISERLRERVRTLGQVPYRSSAENTSPPTTLASTGKAQSAANPRTTSGTAKPDSVTERPNSVSDGRLVCTRIATANANGPATQIASTIRALS